jgi:glycosyltransferase involved in cell wall biosynthesis
MATSDSLAIGWRPSSLSGWGVYGTNLLLQLQRLGRNPVLYLAPHRLDLTSEDLHTLKPVLRRQAHLDELLQKVGVLEFDFPVLHALRNDFYPPMDEQVARGSLNVGVIFFEDTQFTSGGLARAQGYDLIVAGSEWNRRIAEARGLTNVVTVFQGVDTALFKPMPRSARFADRFVVFSGGKLEYRKAQDVVIAAFRVFRARHPEALLMFAWGNQWPGIMPTIARSSYLEGKPEQGADGDLKIGPWLESNGLPPGSYLDLGMEPNRAMPEHLAAADVALFPNRCEPGTNLVAMEAMAAGVPTILAVNTGQADIAGEGHCFELLTQKRVAPYDPYGGTEGWGEPDLDEVIDALEQAYADAAQRRRIGMAGAAFMRKFDWSIQIAELVRRIDAAAVK